MKGTSAGTAGGSGSRAPPARPEVPRPGCRREGLRWFRSAPAVACAVFTLPLVALAVQRSVPALNPVLMAPLTHIVAVTGIAAVSAAVALAAVLPALRGRRAEPLLLALGCLWLSVLFVGHGLMTPGVLGREVSPWLVRLPVLGRAGFAMCQLLGLPRWADLLRRAVGRWPGVLLGSGLAVAEHGEPRGTDRRWPALTPRR